MENYAFKLKGNTLGFFQKNNNNCFIFINSGPFSKISSCDWSHWLRGKENYLSVYPAASYLSEIEQAIGYFSWHHIYDYCEFQPIVTSSHLNDSPGFHYPRVNCNEINLYEKQSKTHKFLDEIRAYGNISNSLMELFNYIDPDTSNLNSHGNKIRELLIIACTEVEYLLLNFLTDNKYKHKEMYNTKDYILAATPLRLREYVIQLNLFPSLDIKPFEGWDDSNPTKSLSWYNAYNAVKHNRGGNKHKASLLSVINAVAAIHVLLEAQYGKQIFNKPLFSNYDSIFHTINYPSHDVRKLSVPFLNHREAEWHGEKYLFNDEAQQQI